MLRSACIALGLYCCMQQPAAAQNPGSGGYDIGNPTVTTLYVDPVNGSDMQSGTSRSAALKTVSAAWEMIPRGVPLSTGYTVILLPGEYPESSLPNYLESRYGTYQAPIIFQAETQRAPRQPSSVKFLGDLNIFDTKYFYLVDIDITPSPAGDAYHCEQCDHILLRRVHLDGGNRIAQETFKANQSKYVYIEDCDIAGADDNAMDFVGVQYGHVLNSRIHNAQDWCIYTKGGSAYFLIEGNEIYNCGTGGYTAGQGTGFEYMVSPWLHYESYDIKFVNNLVHDTAGAGMGVNGGYNILLAFNTLYRVGTRSHGIEAVFGLRSCDGDTPSCISRLAAGGWGVSAGSDLPIPNRNVQIVKNILYNPSGVQSLYQHFAVYGPRTPANGSNVPSPATTDMNLVIRGNVIWNGPSDLPLGIEGADQGCQPGNSSCNALQLAADNAINTIEPQFVDFSAGDIRPQTGGNLFSLPGAIQAIAPQNFSGGDREATPQAPAGNLGNSVSTDRGGILRTSVSIPGAYFSADSTLEPATPILTPTPGPAVTPGSSDTLAPEIQTVIGTVTKTKKAKSLRVAAAITDGGVISEVQLTIKQGRKTFATASMTSPGDGAPYSAMVRLKRLKNTVKKLALSVRATDAAGNSSTRTRNIRVK